MHVRRLRRVERPGSVPTLVGVLAAVAVVAACSSTPAATQAPSAGGQNLAADQTIRLPISNDVGSLDPALVANTLDYSIANNLYDGLLHFDNQFTIGPDLAQSMPTVSADGLTYTFHLRSDAKFWNGDPVTAQDVVFSWDRTAAMQGPYGSDLSDIKGYDQVVAKGSTVTHMSGLSAPDASTVVVSLVHPAGYFLTDVAAFPLGTAVVDQKVVESDPQNWWTNPQTAVGSGPYKLVNRVPKQSLDFAAVSGWWGTPQPTVTKVHFDVVSDLSTAVAKYEQGGYDIVGYAGQLNLPPTDVLRIKANPTESAQLHFQNSGTTFWVGVSFVKGPFVGLTGVGKQLRQALSMAIDRNQLANVACSNAITCSPATGGLITKGLHGYLGDNTNPLAKFDPTQAKSLLKSADPTGSLTANLTYTSDPAPFYKAIAENLQAQWQQNLGLHVNINLLERNQFIQGRNTQQYVLFRDGWAADYDNPQDWFDNIFVTGAGNNAQGYSNPQVDQLAKQADALPIDQSVPLYQQAEKIMIDDAAYIPLVYSLGEFLAKPYVQGAGMNSVTDYRWASLKVLQH